jgi:hypothetical protein
MPEVQQAYERIIQKLSSMDSTVTNGKLFGLPSGKVKGKAFAGIFEESMVFKLYGKSHARALTLPGAHLFDPSGRNRPMKEWVQVPYAQVEHWEELAADALEYVGADLK